MQMIILSFYSYKCIFLVICIWLNKCKILFFNIFLYLCQNFILNQTFGLLEYQIIFRQVVLYESAGSRYNVFENSSWSRFIKQKSYGLFISSEKLLQSCCKRQHAFQRIALNINVFIKLYSYYIYVRSYFFKLRNSEN